ncbi:MAG: DNA-binding protein [Succinivibrionaceae bacterium]|nr:DNA-binding protein [Succinivibrionaceae bacterium]
MTHDDFIIDQEFTPASPAQAYTYTPAETKFNADPLSPSEATPPNNSPNITRQEIEHAVHVLIARGENISINRVRTEIGHGSYSTISRLLKDLGLGSPRLLKHAPTNTAIPKEQQNLLRGLEDECLKLRTAYENITRIEREANERLNQSTARLLDLEFLKDIVLRHFKERNLRQELLMEAGLNNLLTEAPLSALKPLITTLKEDALDFLKAALNQALAQGAHEYIGGVPSIKAIQAMLDDERNKNRMNQSEQAYHF